MATIGDRIVKEALEQLTKHPDGIRYADLVRAVLQSDASFKKNTIHGNVWDLDKRGSSRIYERAAKSTVFPDLSSSSANGAAPTTSPSHRPSGAGRKADANGAHHQFVGKC